MRQGNGKTTLALELHGKKDAKEAIVKVREHLYAHRC